MTRRAAWFLACELMFLACVVPLARAQSADRPSSEDGAIVIHHIARPIGQERYQLNRTDDGIALTAKLDFIDRGGRVELSSAVRLASDLSPISFDATGRTYRFVNIDSHVEVRDGTVHIRNLGAESNRKVPKYFFAGRGYAPLVARALLVQYWEQHGHPRQLTLLPDGNDVTVAFRGVDVVPLGERMVRLRRYSVEGVVWGREALWLDEAGGFAALLTRIHILPLEAVREDLREALPVFQGLAIRDRIADLAELARQQAPPIAEGSFALVGARVLDGRGGDPVDDTTVLVRGGRIAAVGPRSLVPVPDGMRVIRANGKTIVPGLWDMHGHLSQIEWGPAYLAAGVTSARDLGGEQAFLAAFRDALAGGHGIGPRLFLAGLVDGDVSEAYGTIVAATAEQGRVVVDAYRQAGFDQIKLYSRLTPPLVEAIARRAHDAGMTVTGHIPNGMTIEEAVGLGMDQFEHMPFRGQVGTPELQEVVEFLARRGTVASPTLAWDELLGRAPDTAIGSFEPGILRAPAPLASSYNSVRNNIDVATAAANRRRALGIIKMLHDAKVPIVAGTDGALPGHSLLRTLELFVEAGLTPAQAIATATTVPAKFMRVDKDVGTIEPGMRADLLVLDADPLQNISNIRKGRWVVANGRLYDCAALWRSVGFVPQE
jgi:imidazolonepropionase-like amidohydrolase